MSILKIQGRVKDYDWGRTDNANLVYVFSGQEWKEQKYAELWMGSHPSAPSLLGKETLLDYLKANNLPQLSYLFKILSIQKCLSIQAHPSKKEAQQLHVKFPNLYPDPNDKPEMFLTLTNFKCLMGFVTDEEVQLLVGKEPFADFKAQNVREALQEVLLLPKEEIARRVRYVVENRQLFKGREQFLKTANDQFPDDVGILVSLFLQYRELPPGEAYYIKAGQPHAYVQGECLELMKNSDNVVRLGLTPKHKDTDTLLRILDYNDRSIEKLTKHDGHYQAGQLLLHEVLTDQQLELKVPGIGIILDGQFTVNGCHLNRKDIFLVEQGKVSAIGNGKLYIATTR